MLQFNTTTIDVYKPNRNISNEGEMRTATYYLIFTNILCEIIEATGQEKLMMGVNANQPLRRLFVEPKAFIPPLLTIPGIILQGFSSPGYSMLQGLERSYALQLTLETMENTLLNEFYIVKMKRDNTVWVLRDPVNNWISPHEYLEAKLFLLKSPPREIL